MSTIQTIQITAVADSDNIYLTWNSETRTVSRARFNDLINNFGLRTWDILIAQIAIELSNRSIDPMSASQNQLSSVINALNLKF